MYKTFMDYLPSNGVKNNKNFEKKETQLEAEVAKEFKVVSRTVSNYISLLSLPKGLKSSIILNHGDNKKGFGVSYGFELARLPEEQILDFYEIYKPKNYLFGQYQKKITEQINENKLEGGKRKKKLQSNLDKAQLELEKLIQRKGAFDERINKSLEKLKDEYDNVEGAIEFLDEQLDEFQSEERLNKLAKDIKNYEHQANDLDVLLVRTEKESISTCPYCLAKIDIAIINKRRDLFEGEVKGLRDELKKVNSVMDFSRNLKKDLEGDYELLLGITGKIDLKEKEIGGIESEFGGI